MCAATSCRFEDRTPGGSRRDDTSIEGVAASFYAVLAAHDTLAIGFVADRAATVLADAGATSPGITPVIAVFGSGDRRTVPSGVRIIRTELHPDGDVASAQVVVASRDDSGELEAVDVLMLARSGGKWRVAHAMFGAWRQRSLP